MKVYVSPLPITRCALKIAATGGLLLLFGATGTSADHWLEEVFQPPASCANLSVNEVLTPELLASINTATAGMASGFTQQIAFFRESIGSFRSSIVDAFLKPIGDQVFGNSNLSPLSLDESTLSFVFASFDPNLGSILDVIGKIETLGNGFYTCINAIGEDGLDIEDGYNVATDADGVSTVLADFRKTTLLEVTQFNLNYIMTEIGFFEELLTLFCSLTAPVKIPLLVSGGVGVELGAGIELDPKGICEAAQTPIMLATLGSRVQITNLLKMIEFKLYVDGKYNGFVGFQYDAATYENVLRLLGK